MDLSADPAAATGTQCGCVRARSRLLTSALDNTLIQLCEGALLDGRPVRLSCRLEM